MLEFRILGPLEIGDDGGALPLGGQKQRALLAVLLVHAGEVLATDRLVDELWGEHPPRTATTSLQNFVAQLRKVLPPDVLATRAPGYLLDVEPDQVDARRFERLLQQARGLPAAERAQVLREALALWRGKPLAEFAYERFAETEVPRLEALRLSALEERIDADLELGLGAELVPELEALVGEQPLSERLRGQLMVALYRAGRQADALQAYHDARRVLVDELGIEPTARLQELYRSILRQETALDPSAVTSETDDHVGDAAQALLAGRLVIVLGAGANSESPAPSLDEVSAHLARAFDYREGTELARVAQYVAVAKGPGPLYDELHAALDRDCEPGPVHRGLTDLARDLAAAGAPPPLLVTTNFDQVLERAFADAGVPLEVVVYLALGRHRGKFLHVTANGSTQVVEIPNAYTDLTLEAPTLFKIHGGIDRRPEREWESFVVSEDDYIDYLAQADLSVVLPVTLAARLRRSHFLFLGYPLHEWRLRVFLHRLFGREKVGYRSWAIGPAPAELERELWRQSGIEIYDVPLAGYLERLRAYVEAKTTR